MFIEFKVCKTKKSSFYRLMPPSTEHIFIWGGPFSYGFKAVTSEYTPGRGICLGEVKPTDVRNSEIS